MCHLPVCYAQPIYVLESERKSDGQCEQAVSSHAIFQWCILVNVALLTTRVIFMESNVFRDIFSGCTE